MKLSPPPLKSGDKIRIVSTAGKIERKKILPAVKWLEQEGYTVLVGENVFSDYFQFAGTDEQRLSDLQTAINDPDCAAIVCSRGGYGTVRLLEKLDITGLLLYPKWLVGYSDITALHLLFNHLGIPSIHGTMPGFYLDSHGAPTTDAQSLMKLLQGDKMYYQFKSKHQQKAGIARGELAGGNLSVICSLMGTRYEIDTNGKILFLEEIDEYLYHIDRMMHQLRLSGKLANLAGLLIGDFTGTKDNPSPFGMELKDIVMESVEGYDFPVSFGLRAGHGEVNQPLVFGMPWEMKVNDRTTVLKQI